MPKEEWGVKRVCPNCSTRFYDLQRDPMTCPSCGHSISLESLISSGKGRSMITEKASPAKAAPDEDLDTDDDVIDDDDGTDVDLDDDVLDDDDDDNVSLDDIADVSSNDDDES